MNERMSNEKAREEIKMLYAFLYDGLSEKQKQALDIAIESLDNEWVDVRDRLPSEDEDVFEVTIKNRETFINFTSVALWDGKIWRNVYDGLPYDKQEIIKELPQIMREDDEEFASFTKEQQNKIIQDVLDKDTKFLEIPEEIIAWKPLPQPYERKE